MGTAINIFDIRAAADRLRPHLTQTPLLSSPALDQRSHGKVLVKAECLQQTGSFKIRGALNALLQLSPEQRRAGVVAYSSGNHAQGVALAARIAGVQATIVMPEDAPKVKLDRTRRYGAELVRYSRRTESREDIAQEISDRTGAVLIPPFEHPHIIAGQGTVGLELADQAGQLGVAIDQVLVCCSGGGLSSGVGLAIAENHPGAELIVVEPEGYDDMTRSLRTGQRVSITPTEDSICDALLLRTPGAMTFGLLKQLGARGVTVSDDDALAAVRFAAEELKVVLEPGGAVALAAVLSGQVVTRGRCTTAILTGGNVDADMFRRAMTIGGGA